MFYVHQVPLGGILGPKSQFWQKLPFWPFLESFPCFRFGIYGAKRESKSTLQYNYTPSGKYGLLASKNDFQALGSDEKRFSQITCHNVPKSS